MTPQQNPPPASPTTQPQPQPLVTVITAHGGNPLLARCVESVAAQSHGNVQHLVVADGPHTWEQARAVARRHEERGHIDLIQLPYPTGTNRWKGHRIYGAGLFLARGEYLAFLDDDNTMAPTHLSDCLAVCRQGRQWSYALRNIVDREHRFVCRDDCESLGRWPSVLNDQDYMVDVSCYFLPRLLAMQLAPLWFNRTREPGQPEVDRLLCHALRRIAPDYDCTYRYTIDYMAGNTGDSVTADFFLRGNAKMLQRHGGRLPWARDAAG